MALRSISVSHHRPSLDTRRSYKGKILAFTADPIEDEDGNQCVGHQIHYDDDEVRWHELGGRRYTLYRRCARPAIAAGVLQNGQWFEKDLAVCALSLTRQQARRDC